MLRHLALLTMAASTVGAVVAGMNEPPPARADDRTTTTLSCGGYDAQGEVVNEAAVAIGTVEVPADGPVTVPEVCGGYTEDGLFIGDD